jgi:hypothetical protein
MLDLAAAIPAPRTSYEALVAQAAGRSSMLAEVELGDLVYPLNLRWGDHVLYVDGRAEFETARESAHR